MNRARLRLPNPPCGSHPSKAEPAWGICMSGDRGGEGEGARLPVAALPPLSTALSGDGKSSQGPNGIGGLSHIARAHVLPLLS